MSDLTVTVSGELEVAGVESHTEAGQEFADAWFPTRQGAEFEVLDSGRLVIQAKDVIQLRSDVTAAGLTIELVKGL